MDPFLEKSPYFGLGEFAPLGGGTMYNRIVYPPKPPLVELRAEWQITFEDTDVTDSEEQGTMVSQAMNEFTMEDDPV